VGAETLGGVDRIGGIGLEAVEIVNNQGAGEPEGEEGGGGKAGPAAEAPAENGDSDGAVNVKGVDWAECVQHAFKERRDEKIGAVFAGKGFEA
jgi:hypothetical protein